MFRRDLPPRAAPYSRDEVAAAVDACAAIELVTSRYRNSDAASNLEKLADSISNGAFVHAAPPADWRSLELGKLKVTLTVNGAAGAGAGRRASDRRSARRCGGAGEHDARTGRRARRPVRHLRLVHRPALSASQAMSAACASKGWARGGHVRERPAFRGNAHRHDAALKRWLTRSRREQALEPDLPIVDPHHHLWDDERGPYLLPTSWRTSVAAIMCAPRCSSNAAPIIAPMDPQQCDRSARPSSSTASRR